MVLLPPNVSTTHWRATETSLTRESFNDIVSHRGRTNVPEVLVRHGGMSRLAMLATPILENSDFSSSRRQARSISGFRKATIRDPSPDGFGSIRRGTPTFEDLKRKAMVQPLSSSQLARSSSMPNIPMPFINATPHARYGYMAPGEVRIDPRVDGLVERTTLPAACLSKELSAKIVALFNKMDDNKDGHVTKEEARKSFKTFADVSVHAMFNEVDVDNDDFITFEEFVKFWEQVKSSGYPEEELLLELDELLAGNVWVDYQDERDVGLGRQSLGNK